jgi:hypothetical protein
MYNEIINVVKKAVDVVSLDAVIFIGLGVAGLALILGLGRVIFKKRLLSYCRYKTPFVVVLAWLYLVFAFFVISTTKFTGTLPPFSEFIINMAFPIAVVLLTYVIAWFFNWTVHCKVRCAEYEGKHNKEPKWAKEERKDSAVIIVENQDANEIEGAEIKEPKNKKDKDDSTAEINDAPLAVEDMQEAEEKEVNPAETEVIEVKPLTTSSSFTSGEADTDTDTFIPKITPILSNEPVQQPYTGSVNAESTAKIDRISKLEEEIERQRQKNVQITDGVKANTFSGVATQNTYSGEPKVVVRTITEQVQTAPAAPQTPNTGFTAARITERTERSVNQSGATLGVSNATTTTANPYLSSLSRPSLTGNSSSPLPRPALTGSSASSLSRPAMSSPYSSSAASSSLSYDSLRASSSSFGTNSSANAAAPKRSTQDILSSLAELRKSMGNK